jgi:glutamine---fructose-6-phosphate transaminase (isomerizing)
MDTGGARILNEKICVDIARLGGRCLAIESYPILGAQSHNVRTVDLPDASPELLPILEIIPIQLLLIPMARARGFEPAAFLNSSKVTIVE